MPGLMLPINNARNVKGISLLFSVYRRVSIPTIQKYPRIMLAVTFRISVEYMKINGAETMKRRNKRGRNKKILKRDLFSLNTLKTERP